MANLTAHEVEQLVSLRLAVEDGRLQARRAGTYRRGAAIVALDAAVERASALVAFTRGIRVSPTTKLDDLISGLKESLGSRWVPTVLPDIKHLRRARNAAQHEGLEPDRDQIPRWASAAEAYVATLIDAEFSIDILRVVLADAIDDDALRDGVRRAELARSAGEYLDCVNLSERVYLEALGRWKKLRDRHSPSIRSSPLGFNGDSDVQKQLKGLERTMDAAAFGGDVADAEWFTAAISERGNVYDAEDAERATSFVFEWVTGFERAAAAWTPNRRHRADVVARLVRSNPGAARLNELVSTELQFGVIRAVLRIINVPAEEDYQNWAVALGVHLGRVGGAARWEVRGDGTVVLETPIIEAQGIAESIVLLAAALAEAETTVRDQQLRTAAEDAAKRERKLNLESGLRSVADEIPDWIASIEWAEERSYAPGCWEITLSRAVMGLPHRRGNGHDRGGDPDLASMIRDHEMVEQCFIVGNRGSLGIMPALNPGELLSVIQSVDGNVREMLASDKQAARDEKDLLDDMRVSGS